MRRKRHAGEVFCGSSDTKYLIKSANETQSGSSSQYWEPVLKKAHSCRKPTQTAKTAKYMERDLLSFVAKGLAKMETIRFAQR